MAALSNLTQARVSQLLGSRATPQQVAAATRTFEAALVSQLSRGVSVEAATARAQQTLQAQLPTEPSTPAAATRQALVAADPAAMAASLSRMSQASTQEGNSAFERQLSSALARGRTMEQALAAAREAVRDAELAAAADARPGGQLSGAGAAPAALVEGLSDDSQKALGVLLGRGLSAEAAIARAQAQQEQQRKWEQADAGNPTAQLSQGAAGAAPPAEPGGFDQALGAALLRGGSPEQALARAQAAARESRAAEERDVRSASVSLVQGRLPEGRPTDDRALGVALARGISPQQALARVQQQSAPAPQNPSPAARLSTDADPQAVQPLLSGSRVYQRALQAALAKGVAPDKAIEQARRAERSQPAATNRVVTVRIRLPGVGTVSITLDDGAE
jgi:hypothetical protein